MKTSKRRPKRQKVIVYSRLRLTQRHHTGHVLPRQHTSYPVLLFIMLLVGVFMYGWTIAVGAGPSLSDSYTVHARVPSPPPTEPAPITSPLDGTHFKTVPITVSGTCPLTTYVELFRNDVFSGVAICEADGTWSLQTDLFAGANELHTQVFSYTDTPGPLSASITVYYDVPKPPITSSSGGRTPSNAGKPGPANPLILKTKFVFKGYYTGTASNRQISVEGGVPPYAIHVDWGDGSSDLFIRQTSGSFNLKHTYQKAGGYKGSYPLKITASDSAGNQTLLQLLAIINDPLGAGAASTGKGGSSGSNQPFQGFLRILWPSYLIALLMLVSFWLGERREFQILKPRLKKLRRA